ncbi:MAG TPA: hypothetical protein VIY49_35990 [Bryobacteraceae bacterium]
MLRTGLMMVTFGGMMAWAQAQDTTPAPTDKVQAQDTNASSTDKIDRASAYYHYALAQLYYEMSFRSGGNKQVYLDKATEEYKEAAKADPQTPPLRNPFLLSTMPAPKPPPPAPKSSPPPGQK